MEPAPYLAAVVGLAVLCQWLAWRWKIPSLLLLLLTGFALGQWVTADAVVGQHLLFAGVTLCVGIILFEGALGLRFTSVQDLGRPILRVCSLTVLLAWAGTTLTAWTLGFDLRVALLVGAILVVTGPTVINPILRTLRPTRRVSQLLRWEGIVVDPIGAILAVLVFQAVTASGEEGPFIDAALTLGRAVGIAVVLTLTLGWTLTWMMRRNLIPDYLHGVSFLAVAVGALVMSNEVQAESGLLTVTLLGIYLANQSELHLGPILEFKEHLQVLFVGALFVVLAGRVTPTQLSHVWWQAAIFVAVLVIAVRPLSVGLGLWGTDVSRAERTLMMAMAPRGIVAAAVTSIFALEFHAVSDEVLERSAAAAASGDAERAQTLADRGAELALLAAEADRLVPLVFLVIVATVAIYGLGIGHLAERLGLATTRPRGILFAGASPWIVASASRLKELGVPSLIVSRERRDLAGARMAGLRTEAASILSEYAVEDMDLAGINSMIAATGDDATNTIATGEFGHVLGRAQVFQLQRAEDGAATGRKGTADHLTAATAFVPPMPYSALLDRSRGGWRVTATTLSKEFTYAAFWARHPQAVVMFVHRPESTQVAHRGMADPAPGDSLVALVPDDEQERKERRSSERQRKARARAESAGPAPENGSIHVGSSAMEVST